MSLYLIKLNISDETMQSLVRLAERKHCTADDIVQDALEHYIQDQTWQRTGGRMGPIVQEVENESR